VSDRLTSAPPLVDVAEVSALLAAQYGLAGPLTQLTSERDLNLRLVADGQSYVVKFANKAEPRGVTDLQTAALLYIERKGLAVPRVVRTLSGATEVDTAQGLMRVLTYLEGRPMHEVPRSAGLRTAMGAVAARLALGLQGFSHPSADHVLQWDIRRASALRGMLDAVPPALAGLCAAVLDRLDARVAPRLAGVRWQVAHNDLNPHNVLVDRGCADRISGVLDFGDMVFTPLVCDAGVAASYQVDPDKPLESLVDFAAGYHGVLPFRADELALLADLTATRMLTTICITSWRAVRYPENADYILRNYPSARDGLQALSALPRDAVQKALEDACPME
jgi:hydroxylysine kinase